MQKQTLVLILLAAAAGVVAAEMPRPAADEPAAGAEEGPGPAADGLEADGPEAEAEAAAPRFEDWELACADEGCRIRTRVLAAEGTEVLRIEAGGTPAVLRFVTPLGLHLPDGLVAVIGAGAERRLPWRTCGAEAGCLADASLDPELLAALRRERAGTAGFTLVEGVPVRLGFSLIGFSAAWRALGAAE